MILVFLFLGLLILSSLLFLLASLSNIKIDINRVHIEANKNQKFKISFIIKFSFCLFNKLRYFTTTIDNQKINLLYNSGKIDINKFRQDRELNKEVLKALRRTEYTIEKFKLNGEIGTDNAAFTALSIGFLNSIIPIFVLRKIKFKNIDNYYLNINPIFINQNLVNLDLNCIISIKLVNIINIIHFLLKKGRVNKNERTSNRRSYAYSYE